MMLPEHAFGSWLKDNAGGLLKGAGSIVSALPGVGQIAGPILSVAGSVVEKNKADKLAVEQQKEALKLQEETQRKEQFQNDQAIRMQNIMSQAPQINYGATFAYGGDLLMDQNQSLQNPQIVNYSNKADLHSEGIGGVPVDIKGNPVKVSRKSPVGITEGGEITYNGYVFSNKLKVRK